MVETPFSTPAGAGWYTGDLDFTQAAPARVYDHLLGGMSSTVADRSLARRMQAAMPDVAWIAWANAVFVDRAVRHLVAAEVDQFLDLGCGVQGVGGVQRVLIEVAPGARVVHVDIDPIAVAHTRHAILAAGRVGRAAAVEADIRDPLTMLRHCDVQRLLDLGEPVGVLATAVLHHLEDQRDARRVLAELSDAIVAGSYLVFSHLTGESRPRDVDALVDVGARAGIPITARTRAELAEVVDGWTVLDPGLVWASQWNPVPEGGVGSEPTPDDGHEVAHEPEHDRCCLLSAVARRPSQAMPDASRDRLNQCAAREMSGVGALPAGHAMPHSGTRVGRGDEGDGLRGDRRHGEPVAGSAAGHDDAVQRVLVGNRAADSGVHRNGRGALWQLPGGAADLGLGELGWEQFGHACAGTRDMPGLLRRLADQDPAVARHALDTLRSTVCRDGTTHDVGPLVGPVLIRLAATRSVHHRHLLLWLAGDLGRVNHHGVASRSTLLRATRIADRDGLNNGGHLAARSIQAVQTGLAADVTTLLTLLIDPDRRVRIGAAYALSAASDHRRPIEAALRLRLAAEGESEPAVRISLILAIAEVIVAEGLTEAGPAWARNLWSDPARSPDLRLGAAIAWLCLTDAPPPTPLLDVLSRATTPPSVGWMRTVPWANSVDQHGGLGAWLAGLLDDAHGPRLVQAGNLAASPHPLARVGACRAAYDVAARWRPPTQAALSRLAALLSDPDPHVALTAAGLLTRVGDATTTVADRLAAALGRAEVGAWAAVALAHVGDPRAVAPLARLLRLPTNPWCASLATFDLHLIDRLSPHAAALVPAIAHRLCHWDLGWDPVVPDLVRGLGRWGGTAAGAVTALTDCLGQGYIDPATIITTLGQIGPAAREALALLDPATLTGERHTALLAWARWRITGQRRAATAATLAHIATIAPHSPEALRLFADLGPGATPHAGVLRGLLCDADAGVRVEAAHALWRTTGEAREALPVLLREVVGDDVAFPQRAVAVTAAQYLACLASPAAAPAVPVLQAFLDAAERAADRPRGVDAIAWDDHCQRIARDLVAAIAPEAAQQARSHP